LILQRVLQDQDKYQIGLTKIFFRAGVLAVLESLRARRLHELVTLIQKNVRRRIEYKRYQETRQSTIKLQAWWRGITARRQVVMLRQETAATKVQTAYRGYLARRAYKETRQAIVKIQSGEPSLD
jgi:myosin-5